MTCVRPWERLRETAGGGSREQRTYALSQLDHVLAQVVHFFVRPKKQFLEVCSSSGVR
jgi:hypothetical protein